MTLKSWDELPLQLKRNARKLYGHLQDNTSDALDDWEDLSYHIKRSKVKLYDYIATELEGLPFWKDLTYKAKLSRKLRWEIIYHSLTDTGRNVVITVKEGDNVLEGATVTIGGTNKTTDSDGRAYFTNIEDGSTSISVSKQYYTTETTTKTVSRTAMAFTITIARATRTLSFSVADGEDQPIEGAVVKLDGSNTFKGTTGSAGGCTIANVPDGLHTISVTASGYEDYADDIESDSTHNEFSVIMTAETTEESN